ncbi:hypothetical protein JHK87_052481 [Glycine soja]|nr:hypothetical protein JHK87_052481 [Glycine soja]
MNELSTLVEALEGESHPIEVWVNRNSGMVYGNAEDACIYKQDVESAICQTQSYKEGKNSTCAGTNDKSNSTIPSSSYNHISAELVHSEGTILTMAAYLADDGRTQR